MIGRNDPCWCGSHKKWKTCHYPNTGPVSTNDFAEKKNLYYKKHQIILKDSKQIAGIRAASQLASNILDKLCAMAKEGVTTQQLDDYSRKLHAAAGATPACLNYGYPPFPKSICTSLNEVICHGIPNEIPLKAGDIVNIDVTSILKGFYGDCSRMVMIGDVSAEKKLVVDVSYECLMRSIAILKPGVSVSQIGEIIETYAHAQGCSVVNQFVGHGVGVNFHESPQIPHSRNTSTIILTAGMTFTIEPMINAGVREALIDPYDKWTARTRDAKASAQWEHTILITPDGYEILTPWIR